MAQLTNHVIKQFIQKLDNSYFTSASFIVEFPDEGSYVTIKFIDNTNYFYDLSSNQWDSENKYKIICSPGSITKQSEISFKTVDKCLDYIISWTENIKKELKASNPFYSEFEEFKNTLNERLNSYINNGNAYFTKEEINNIQNTIDELSKKIDELHKTNELTAQELKSVKETLENLKEDSKNFPKKTWLRTTSTKLFSITNKFLSSKAGQKLIEEGTKRILQFPE